jgi:hypothetical protein
MQYTIRGIPKGVDRVLRQRAKREGKSLNEIALRALQDSAGSVPATKINHDFDRFAGTWVEDPAFDEAMKMFEQIDAPEDMSG